MLIIKVAQAENARGDNAARSRTLLTHSVWPTFRNVYWLYTVLLPRDQLGVLFCHLSA